MKRFWRRDSEHGEWPEPRPEFLRELADTLRQARAGDRSREVRIGGFKLALAPALILACVLVVAAFVGISTATGAGHGVVTAMQSMVVQHHSPGNPGHHEGNVKAGHHKNGEEGDEDENENEQYDVEEYDHECQNFGEERSALAHHQAEERRQLKLHGGSREERRALRAHQRAERTALKERKKHCENGEGDDD